MKKALSLLLFACIALTTFAQSQPQKPLIGVSNSGTSASSCIRSVESAGGIPVIIPAISDSLLVDQTLVMLDGLLMTDGEDILLRRAKARNIPMLAEEANAAGDEPSQKVVADLVSRAQLFAKAKDIHSRILSVDTHCDTPMGFSRGGSLIARTERQQVSIPKMQEGYLDAQFLAAFLSQGELTKEASKAAVEKCQNIISSIYAETAKYPELCGLAVTEADAIRLKAEGKKAFFIGIENGYGIGNDLSNIKKYFDQGVNYMTLCHSYDNAICNSSTHTADENKGLTAFGKKVVKEMNKVGMVIDLSHASMGTFWDVMKVSKMPVVCTHSGAKDVFFHNRNLNDDQLRALAKNGGVIQVCIFASYMSPDRTKTSIDDVVAHIDHCVKVAGIDHVGIGSDFDGGGGVIGCRGSNDMIMITVKLLEKGYTEQDLGKIWGGNWFRVMNKCRSVADK